MGNALASPQSLAFLHTPFRMGDFEYASASDVIVPVSHRVLDLCYVRLRCNAVYGGEGGREVFDGVMAEGAAVGFGRRWLIGCNDTLAAEGEFLFI